MKKKAIIITAVCLAVILAAGGIVFSKLPKALSYDISSVKKVGSRISEVEYTGDDTVSVKIPGDEYKILMFTDIHLDGKNATSDVTVDNLVKNIEREKPDLVILGGDNITSSFNKKRCRQLAELFENAGIYWAGVLGNHEGDNTFSVSREKMMDIFGSYDHCLMRKGNTEVDGNCNYALNLLNGDGSLNRTFFFLDTMDSMTREQKEQYGLDVKKSYYDGVKASQIEWYKSACGKTREKYGDFESALVMHIPLPQYQTAFDEGAQLLFGEKREKMCVSGFESGLFDVILSENTTKYVFAGHDHLNDFGLMYKDVLLCYMQPSGYGSYTAVKLGYEEKDWLQGGTILTVKSGEKIIQQRFRNSVVNNK